MLPQIIRPSGAIESGCKFVAYWRRVPNPNLLVEPEQSCRKSAAVVRWYNRSPDVAVVEHLAKFGR